MIRKKKKKIITLLFVLIVAILAGTYLGLSYIKGEEAILVSSGIESPYTVEQVEAMMRYHGTLIAKFQGGRWLFLKDGQWISIENGNALKYVLRTTNNTKSPAL